MVLTLFLYKYTQYTENNLGIIKKQHRFKMSSRAISTSSQKQRATKEETVSFDDVCRTCLSSKNKLTDINEITFGDTTVQTIFEQYVVIKVNVGDDLPQQICNMCLYELCRTYLFINNCREADAKLQQLVANPETDDEEDFEESDPPDIVTSESSRTDFLKMGPVKVDEPGPPFVCNNCPNSFETLEEMNVHRTLNKHYVLRQYQCRVCNPSKVYSYRHWRIHMRMHRKQPYACKFCGKRFTRNSNRERHILTHIGEKTHACDVCGKAFLQKTDLKLHQLRVHQKEKQNQQKGHFECEFCLKVFGSKASVVNHEVIHFDKTFLCQECGKSFHYKGDLVEHTNAHLGIRRYKCNQCNSAFVRAKSLRRHKLTHTGVKAYQCQNCNKRFMQKSHLTTHMKTHTGEKPYSCSFCDKKFALNGSLTVHLRKHTGETPYMCDICDTGFYNSSSMKNHRRKHFLDFKDGSQ